MAIAYFPSLAQADTLEIDFAKSDGSDVTMRLLIDSGFMGHSCFVLAQNANLEQAPARDSQVFGALQGSQKRGLVKGRLPALSVQFEALAILADLSDLTLPPQVQGMVGLRFLRMFRRWGAELTAADGWRFFLET
jgi:hypothetical protein